MAVDWQAIGGALAAVGAVATGAWAWWANKKKADAQNRAAVAESNADATVADAQATIYKLLTERVVTLETEMRAVREELSTERRHSRKLELHILKLENLMRTAGMEPPVFEGVG